jgi:hypothetical protein
MIPIQEAGGRVGAITSFEAAGYLPLDHSSHRNPLMKPSKEDSLFRREKTIPCGLPVPSHPWGTSGRRN